MDSSCVGNNSVSYCCIWKGGRILYNYNNGDHEIEKLAALCLEVTPPYHQWYFQTMGKNTFGFLMDDGYVYFAIVYESLGNSQVLRFLHKLRDEFGRVGKRGSSRSSLSSLNSLCLQEQLFPVVRRLVASLEHVAEWPAENSSAASTCNNNNNNGNRHMDNSSASTKAPLLGKPSKQEKKKMKKDHHVIGMRDIEMEEHRRSTDRGLKIEPGTSSASSQLQKDCSRNKCSSSSQNLQKKWCRQVRIVLAIDAAVCVVLFIIWLVICHGTQCIR